MTIKELERVLKRHKKDKDIIGFWCDEFGDWHMQLSEDRDIVISKGEGTYDRQRANGNSISRRS